jgi:hypothetical protein
MTDFWPKLNSGLLFRDFENEGILLNPSTSNYYRITGVGVRITQMLINKGEHGFNQALNLLIDEMERETDADRETISHAIETFLNKLKAERIIIS